MRGLPAFLVVCGCGSGSTTAAAPRDESHQAVDVSANIPANWQPFDNGGWRIHLPPTWEVRHTFDFTRGVQGSPDGDIVAALQERIVEPAEAFAARHRDATRCVVHGEPCWQTTIRFKAADGSPRTGVGVIVGHGTTILASCFSAGLDVNHVCRTIVGSLERISK